MTSDYPHCPPPPRPLPILPTLSKASSPLAQANVIEIRRKLDGMMLPIWCGYIGINTASWGKKKIILFCSSELYTEKSGDAM